LHAVIGGDGEQEVLEKYRTTRAGRGDSQVARRVNWQAISREALKLGA
jgi:hypothetical protein